MDFREMVYITTVADCRSVTAAARKLYISQPSLSHIISKVEQDVGVPLFDRKTSPITLTYAGEKYVDTARKVLLLNDNLRRELMDIGLGEKGKIHFGMPTERAGYMLPAVLSRFRQQYPRVEVRIVEAKVDELIQALGRDEINFFIAPRDSADLPSGIRTEKIYQERLFVVASPEMIEENMRTQEAGNGLNLARMGHLPFIVLKRGHAIRKKTDSIFRRYQIAPDLAMEVSSCISAVQLAAANLGVTIVPQRAVDVLDGKDRICCYDYSDKPDFWDVNAVYKEDIYLDRAERCLIELMKEEFTKGADG